MSFFDRFKKNKEEEELDILDEIKEPFSIDNFIDEQIVQRYQRIRKMLDEKGILFFLMSPFQYRNRLLLKLTAIFLGIVLGIVPRSSSLINQAQERNAASELAQIADRSFNIGKMRLTALESSNYKEQHVFTFLIEGQTAEGVPSTVERYNIDLSPMRGVENPDKVKYYYDIIPIDNSQRMLLMYVDNKEQDDDTGIYGLTIEIAGDEDVKNNAPLEIVLSDTQETTSLFDSSGVDLAILTDVFITESSNRIDEMETALNEKLKGYELMADRLKVDGYRVATDYEFMESYINKYMVLSGLTDETTVRGLPDDAVKTSELKGEDKKEIDLEIDAIISKGEESYSTKARENWDQEKVDALTTEDNQALDELTELQVQANQVTDALKKLNSVRQEKYDNLIDLQRTLNRDINPENLPISDYVEEPKEDEEPKKEKETDSQADDLLEKPKEEETPSSGDSKSEDGGDS